MVKKKKSKENRRLDRSHVLAFHTSKQLHEEFKKSVEKEGVQMQEVLNSFMMEFIKDSEGV